MVENGGGAEHGGSPRFLWEYLLIRGTLGESGLGSGKLWLAGCGGEGSCSFSDSLGL